MKKQLPTTKRSLPIALIRAREVIMPPIRAMLSQTGITEQQWRVLRVLSENGAIGTKTLAQQSSLLLPSLTRIATTMVKKGLITQIRDKQDKRRQIIDITPLGLQLIEDRSEQAAKIVAGFRADLGDDDYELLLDLLNKLDINSRH